MMRNPHVTVYILLVAVSLVLSACRMPQQQTETPMLPTPEVDYTHAVQTVVAQLTLAASTEAVTPLPTEVVEEPVATATLPSTESDEPTPTETLQPTATPDATHTVTPIATPLASDPRGRFVNPAWRDEFSNSDNWSLVPDQHTTMQIKDGKLVMTALNADFFNGWAITWPNIEDYYLEITATSGACDGLDRYGVIFRAPNASQGTLFGFSCDGRYALWIWDGTKEIDLIDWTPSPHILKGANQTNRLGVWVEGDRLSLYANGNLLTELRDDTYGRGFFGVFIGAAMTANYTVKLDEIVYWDVK